MNKIMLKLMLMLMVILLAGCDLAFGQDGVWGGREGWGRGGDEVSAACLFDELEDTPDIAFAMVKVNGNYGGNCLRVRRASDNALLDVGFVDGIVDTTTLRAFKGASTLSVAIWYDQSGNGWNLINTTAGTQPPLTLSGLNGLPILALTNHELACVNNTIMDVTTGNLSLLVHVKQTNNASTGYMINKRTGTDNGYSLIETATNNYAAVVTEDAGGDMGYAPTAVSIAAAWHQVTGTWAPPLASTYLDGFVTAGGTETDAAVGSITNTDRPFKIGRDGAGANQYIGSMNCVMGWLSEVSDADREMIYLDMFEPLILFTATGNAVDDAGFTVTFTDDLGIGWGDGGFDVLATTVEKTHAYGAAFSNTM